MTALIDSVRQDHCNITRLLDALDHQIDVFADARDPDYDVILGIADYFLDYPDACHHPKENRIFHRLKTHHLRAMERVADLTKEHDALHEHTQRFHYTINVLLNDAEISRAAIVESARAFIVAERGHMQHEEERFLPLVQLVLTEEDWAQIESEIEADDALRPSGRSEATFEVLRTRLLAWEREFQTAR